MTSPDRQHRHKKGNICKFIVQNLYSVYQGSVLAPSSFLKGVHNITLHHVNSISQCVMAIFQNQEN